MKSYYARGIGLIVEVVAFHILALLKPAMGRAKLRTSGKLSARVLSLICIMSLFSEMSAVIGRDTNISMASSIPAGSSLLRVFEGTTPCDDVPRPLPQIPTDITCEQMIWKVTLYQDPDTGIPTTFSLNSAYGLPKQNTPDLQGGGTKIEMEGSWAITQSTRTDLAAVVYQLNPGNPAISVSFLKLDDYAIHVLDPDKGLMIGNGGWSYTLNRTDATRPQTSPQNNNPTSQFITAPLPTNSAIHGVFDGRTPCGNLALQFTGYPVANCIKIKWRLTLYQDPNTGSPTTYKYKGSSTTGEGTWRIVQGTKANPAAVVYQLLTDTPGQSVSFLKADDNILLLLDPDTNLLVGDIYFSYTLSRVDTQVSKCFSETGQCLRGIFWQYWERKGGRAQFGLPVSSELIENGRTVQYTEKGRLEFHAEYRGTEYEVLIGRLEAEIATAPTERGEAPFQKVTKPTDDTVKYFPETGHTLG